MQADLGWRKLEDRMEKMEVIFNRRLAVLEDS